MSFIVHMKTEKKLIDEIFAQGFAAQWITAWNAHDLDGILSHYDEDFEMSSPVIVQLQADPTGILRGKPAVRAYWSKALQLIPDLQFELISILVGIQSITLYYKGARGRMSAEVFFFNAHGKVTKAFAHYLI
jgi:hypothetical protein